MISDYQFKLLRVLANRQRLNILLLLNELGPQSVNNIVDKLSSEQSSISHDLKWLKFYHFVDCLNKGKERLYEAKIETVQPILQQLIKHQKLYCQKDCNHDC